MYDLLFCFLSWRETSTALCSDSLIFVRVNMHRYVKINLYTTKSIFVVVRILKVDQSGIFLFILLLFLINLFILIISYFLFIYLSLLINFYLFINYLNSSCFLIEWLLFLFYFYHYACIIRHLFFRYTFCIWLIRFHFSLWCMTVYLFYTHASSDISVIRSLKSETTKI